MAMQHDWLPTSGSVQRTYRWMYRLINGCMDGWMDGWINGWMDGWMDGCMYVCMQYLFIVSVIAREIQLGFLINQRNRMREPYFGES